MTSGLPTKLAALPMYDFPHLIEAHAGLWNWLARQLIACGVKNVPIDLEHPTDLEAFWINPRLLLSQTCGYPLVTELKDKVQLVATPVYAAEGCTGAWHCGCVVAHKDEHTDSLSGLRGKRAAINSWNSNTGMNLFRAAIAPLARHGKFFSEVLLTGSHLSSLEAIVNRKADVACIDCVSLAHFKKYKPELADMVRIVAFTEKSPALPFVTSARTEPNVLILIKEVLRSMSSEAGLRETFEQLLLLGFELTPLSAYDICIDLERRSIALGYASLQ